MVTVAGRSGALPGTGGASVKVTPFAEYPPKGRATGGVRCQRFLKGEDGLIQAWIGPPPVLAATESGVMVDLSDMQGRRDGSGTALTRQLSPPRPRLPPPLAPPRPQTASRPQHPRNLKRPRTALTTADPPRASAHSTSRAAQPAHVGLVAYRPG